MSSSKKQVVKEWKGDWNDIDSLKTYCKDDKLMYTSTKTSHRRKILCLEWSVDGKYLASGSQDSTTCIYRLDTPKSFTDRNALFHLDAQKSPINSLDWNPKIPSVLGTASEDALVYLWNINKFGNQSQSNQSSTDNKNNNNNSSSSSSSQCKPYHIIKTGNSLTGISWSNDGTKICITDSQNTINLVDGYKYTEIKKHKIQNSQKKLHSFKWSSDDKYILITTKDGWIEIYESKTLTKVHEFQVHCGNCFCLDLCNDFIVTGGADSMISVIDRNNLIQKYCSTVFETSVMNVSINFNDKLLASADDGANTNLSNNTPRNHMINISYLDDPNQTQICRINTQTPINVLKWHPTKHLLAFSADLKNDYNNLSVPFSNNNNNNIVNNHRSSTRVNIWGALKDVNK